MPLSLADLLAHWTGEGPLIAFGAYLPERTLIIDPDECSREVALEKIGGFLRRAGIPFVAFAAPQQRAPHFWIRLQYSLAADDLESLSWLFETWLAKEVGKIELFPKNRGCRLPLGLHQSGEAVVPIEPVMTRTRDHQVGLRRLPESDTPADSQACPLRTTTPGWNVCAGGAFRKRHHITKGGGSEALRRQRAGSEGHRHGTGCRELACGNPGNGRRGSARTRK